MGNLWGFFENINEIVYVANIETYELVYMNKRAREVFWRCQTDAGDTGEKGELFYALLSGGQ